MPLRPKYSLSQDEEIVTLTVHVPYVRVGDAEIVIDGAEVSLWCKPYLLKLVLPGEVKDEEHATATYDPNIEHGTLTIKLVKATQGMMFPDLDLPGRLLAPDPVFPDQPFSGPVYAAPEGEGEGEEEEEEEGEGAALASRMLNLQLGAGVKGLPQDNNADEDAPPPRSRPLVEVIASQDNEGEGEEDQQGEGQGQGQGQRQVAGEAEGQGDWRARADKLGYGAPASPTPTAVDLSQEHGYGFNRRHRGLFSTLREEASAVVSLPQPEAVPAAARPVLRVAHEDAAFDADRYAGDFMGGTDDSFYQEAVGGMPWWGAWAAQVAQAHVAAAAAGAGEGSGAAQAPVWKWEEKEAEAMASLRMRELLVDGKVARVGGGGGGGGGAGTGSSTVEGGSGNGEASMGPEATRLIAALSTLLFAYAYDQRLTGGEPNVESGWTMATLSPALAWLDDELLVVRGEGGEGGGEGGGGLAAAGIAGGVLSMPAGIVLGQGSGAGADIRPVSAPVDPLQTILQAASEACMRRVLTFPYLRRWDLGQLCLQDAALLMSLGRRPILRALLSMRAVFAHDTDDKSGAPRYLLNSLWTDDLVCWLQATGPGAVSDGALARAGQMLASVAGQLSKTGDAFAAWNLVELEELALEQGQDEEEEEEDEEEDEEEGEGEEEAE